MFCFKTSKVATGDTAPRPSSMLLPRLDVLPRAEPSASHRGLVPQPLPQLPRGVPKVHRRRGTPTRSQGNPPARGHASLVSSPPSSLWVDYAEWTKARAWPDDVANAAAYRHVVTRNIIVAQCRARDRATVHWRNMGRKLRARAAHAYRADSWVRKAREELSVARRHAALQLERDATNVKLQVWLLGKPERERRAQLEEEERMYERVLAAKQLEVHSSKLRTWERRRLANETLLRCPRWYSDAKHEGELQRGTGGLEDLAAAARATPRADLSTSTWRVPGNPVYDLLQSRRVARSAVTLTHQREGDPV